MSDNQVSFIGSTWDVNPSGDQWGDATRSSVSGQPAIKQPDENQEYIEPSVDARDVEIVHDSQSTYSKGVGLVLVSETEASWRESCQDLEELLNAEGKLVLEFEDAQLGDDYSPRYVLEWMLRAETEILSSQSMDADLLGAFWKAILYACECGNDSEKNTVKNYLLDFIFWVAGCEGLSFDVCDCLRLLSERNWFPAKDTAFKKNLYNAHANSGASGEVLSFIKSFFNEAESQALAQENKIFIEISERKAVKLAVNGDFDSSFETMRCLMATPGWYGSAGADQILDELSKAITRAPNPKTDVIGDNVFKMFNNKRYAYLNIVKSWKK